MRAGAIILNNDKVAMIERFREGNHYFVFPGGSPKKDEPLEEAAVREVLEETGLIVKVDRLVAIVKYETNEQYYFLVEIHGGDFGSGLGKEMMGLAPPERGKYIPVWKRISELPNLAGWPRPLFDLVSRFREEGIPEQAIILEDNGGISAPLS